MIDYASASVAEIIERTTDIRSALTNVRGFVDGRVEFELGPSHDKRAVMERELAEALLIHLPAAVRRETTP